MQGRPEAVANRVQKNSLEYMEVSMQGRSEAVANRAQKNSLEPMEVSMQGRPEAVMSIAKAADCPKEEVALAGSCGCISGEFAYLYPPGIPMLVPGERISGEVLEQLLTCQSRGQKLQGLRDYQGENILVVRESREST